MTPLRTPQSQFQPKSTETYRLLKGITFQGLFDESYREWGEKPPEDTKKLRKSQNLSKASQILDLMNWFSTKKENEIMNSAGNGTLKELIASTLSNCVAHSTSAKYIELNIQKKPQKLQMPPGKKYKKIPCTTWDDYK